MDYATQWHCTGTDLTGILDYTCDVTATSTSSYVATSTAVTASSSPNYTGPTYSEALFMFGVLIFFVSFTGWTRIFAFLRRIHD